MKVCRHFGECGGCSFQDVPYQEQLRNKEKLLKELCVFNELGVKPKSINAFREWFYRNKMEFTFSTDEKGSLVCGMHKKKEKRKVFELKECLIFSSHAGELIEKVTTLFRGKYSAYNTFTHKGFLRHLIVREAKFTKEIMVGLVTTSEYNLVIDKFLHSLFSLSFGSRIKSVYWIVNDSFGDAVIFENKTLLYGDPFITEQLNAYKFRVYIDSFFQTNVYGIRELYTKIARYAELNGTEKILDLFCGAGGIGIFLAERAHFVWGVELEKEIVANAYVNAELNNIKNISFICSDSRKFLATRDVSGMDIVVINPPRSGLSKKIKRRLLCVLPPTIFYSSCNSHTLCADLKEFSSHYTIECIEPFDFFPHTSHIECLSLLRRKAVST